LPRITRVKLTRINLRTGSKKILQEAVAVEAPISLYVNDELVTTIMATPFQIKELAVGWLLDEGILRELKEADRIWIEGNGVKVKTLSDVKMRIEAASVSKLITTGCGSMEEFIKLLDRLDKPFVDSSYSIRAEEILRMTQELNDRAKVFRETGGTHSAALFFDGKIAAFAEDVGRHSAVDKCIGTAALSGVDFSRCVVVSSGRQPADMVLKAARVGIPIVASIAGPMQSGVYAAQITNVTLICFVRGQRMNVYAVPERILFPH
jgi:FdhD protein